MMYHMPLNGIHNTYVLFNSNYSVGFITSKNLNNLETIGIFAGDEDAWVYQAIKQNPEILKTMKCYPYRKRMTIKQINDFTEEEFLEIIFPRKE